MRKKIGNGIILSKTESIPIELCDRKKTKFKGNEHTLVIGCAGSGKTRFFVKPNLMQMNSSYVIMDNYGLLNDVGKLLAEVGHYKIKIFNLIDYKKSFHYNPFAYLRSEKDIFTLVSVIISNTKGVGEKSGEDFWVQAERLLYTAFIGYIYYECPKSEQNFTTLISLINKAEDREDDEDFRSCIDTMFKFLMEKNPNHFAVNHYKKFKFLAGRKEKSILFSCAARLSVFDDNELQALMSYDEMEFETLGGITKDDVQKTALFISFPPMSCDMSLIIAMLHTQLFNVLLDRAENVFEGGLPIPVHFMMNDFQAIGEIPDFDKLLALLKSRRIWVSIIIQSISEIKRTYNDFSEEIINFFDNFLYLGTMDPQTREFLSKYLGIENLYILLSNIDYDMCLVFSNMSYFFSHRYDITKHRFYHYISDYDKGNSFSFEKYLEEK